MVIFKNPPEIYNIYLYTGKPMRTFLVTFCGLDVTHVSAYKHDTEVKMFVLLSYEIQTWYV